MLKAERSLKFGSIVSPNSLVNTRYSTSLHVDKKASVVQALRAVEAGKDLKLYSRCMGQQVPGTRDG